MRLFLYLIALLTGLAVPEMSPVARAAPVAVDTVMVGNRAVQTPVRARASGCILASSRPQRPQPTMAQNGARGDAPVPASTPQRRCDRLLE